MKLIRLDGNKAQGARVLNFKGLRLREICKFAAQYLDTLALSEHQLVEFGQLLLVVTNMVADREEPGRHRRRADAPEGCCSGAHAASFSAARIRAERARGLAAISTAPGRTARR
ncbi:MAG: hypothetical protein OXF51_10240, partial [Alphaproteobacteria bacterium]|nr:hypothetical protein [Alphaproteobacteria bacterium]